MGKIRNAIEYLANDPRSILYSAGAVGLGDLALGIQSNDLARVIVSTVGGFLTFGGAMYGKMDFDEQRELDNHTQMDTYHKAGKVKA